ncbi:MAG: YhdH/YhfP family quinone oxidoreductase [Cyclobacteriaceae bacterium]|nr:YhdH/YhfP family quinone oxidoreductase [Cyclobacteriaceae bacterium]
MSKIFRALRITEDESGKFHRNIIERNIDDLPDGEVLIKIHYAALNFKDALSSTGNKGVTKNYPHTPGIDGAGVVVESKNNDFKEGDEVLVTSYDLGMNTDGAFAGYIRVPSAWVVKLPSGLSLKESMIIGTAGLTAGIGLYKLEMMGQSPDQGSVAVSGASGGVGSMAVGMLAKAGYQVIASSGKENADEFLKNLGASEVVDRDFINDDSSRPLIKPKWAGAIDTVGGNTLATLLKGCKPGGSVGSCGLVGSPNLSTTVFPFIINGINLLGLDSANFPMKERQKVWNKLASVWKLNNLESVATICTLDELDSYITGMLKGEVKGRVVVEMEL